MTALIEGTLTEIPLKDSGEPYDFALYIDDSPALSEDLHNSVFFAETRTELVARLLPGYMDLSDDDAFLARHEAALMLASTLQEDIAAKKVVDREWDHKAAGEDVLTAVFTPRVEGPAFEGEWTEPVPLVQVTTQFAPYTALPPVTGNIIWIDPADEKVFLESLAAAGAFGLVYQAGE